MTSDPYALQKSEYVVRMDTAKRIMAMGWRALCPVTEQHDPHWIEPVGHVTPRHFCYGNEIEESK